MKNTNLFLTSAVSFFISISAASPLRAGDVSNSDIESFFKGSGDPSALTDFLDRAKSVEAVVPSPSESVAPAEAPKVYKSTNTNDFIHFWEKLKEGVFDDICKEAQIKLNEGASIDNVGGIEGKFKRYLKQFPDNHIALIDEVGVKLQGGYVTDIFQVGDIPFNVSINGLLEGKSIVVRKLENVKYCKEIDTLIDLRKVKTILPINAKRFSDMKVSEIWKFPITLRIGLGGSIGVSPQPYFSLSFSLGTTKEKRPSVTLYRMDPDTLRLRLRLDRVNVVSGGVSAGTSFDAGLIGLPEAENIFTKFLEKTIAKEFNKYLSFRFGLSHSRTKGKKILIEFLLNPKNPEQMEKLSDFLKGDLGVIRKLIKMGIKFNDFSEIDSPQEGIEQMSEIVQDAEESLGTDNNFAGTNHYHGNSTGFNFQLPLIHRHEWSSGMGYNRYQSLEGNEVLHSFQTSKNSEGRSINIPFVGTIVKHNTQQNTYVVNYQKNSGHVSEPIILYQRYEGFVRRDEYAARQMVENVNDILKYTGMKGEGTTSEYIIPTAPLFPILVEQESIAPEYDEYHNQTNASDRRSYHSAVIAFNLVFGKQAVQDVLAAPLSVIVKSYFNILESTERAIINKIWHLFTVKDNGTVDYNYKEARNILEKEFWHMFNSENQKDPMQIVSELAHTATCLVKDIIEAKNITDWRKQSEKISKMLAGKGRTSYGYEDMLKIFIQLVNPKDIYAKFTMQTNKKIKGEQDISLNNNMFSEEIQNSFESQYADATALRDRFSDPSTLTD